ncbi:MAG: NTP transferase domain-containing protein [Bacteroidetes bacterium]|nr:NTP transferase domain-containing protein [Bacteroidota bacterium]
MKHKKHDDIARPSLGQFGRNEWAILGTNCGEIKQLAGKLNAAFSSKYKIGYVDADHQEVGSSTVGSLQLEKGTTIEFTDKIAYNRLDFMGKPTQWQFRPLFNEMDLVLVNGNHFTAKKQVVVIDPKKQDSLKRKLDRLTDVHLILLTDPAMQPFDFLKENLPDFKKIPVLQLADFQKIKSFFEEKLTDALPPLNGLVLVGGKSRRMGTDKSILQYHDKPQRDVMIEVLDKFCQKTKVSCRPEQAGELVYTHDVLPDTFLGLGPMGAILSAFRQEPDTAWLVVACDLPLLDEAAIRFLVENRNPSAIATAFRSPVSGFPEPLVAIWEPKSYPVLLQFLAQGYSCPRKVLINSPVEVLEAPNPDVLMNVNTPDEVDVVLKKLGVEGF